MVEFTVHSYNGGGVMAALRRARLCVELFESGTKAISLPVAATFTYTCPLARVGQR